MSMRPLVLVVLLLLVVPATTAAAAKPHWTPPQELSTAHHDNEAPVVEYATFAGNARGDRLVVWRADRGLMYAFARRGGRFHAPRRIASPWYPSEFMQAAVDAHGRAVIAWTAQDNERAGEGHGDFGCCERLLGAIVRPGAPAPRTRLLSLKGDDVEGPRLAVSPSGRIGLVWGYHLAVSARFGSTRRGFGPIEQVSKDFGFPSGIVLGTRYPRVAVQKGYPGHLTEFSRRRAGVYRRGAAVTWEGFPLGSDARGREVLVRDEERNDFSGLLELATRNPGGELRTRTLASHTASEPGYYQPQLDVAPSGAAAVAWSPDGADTVTAVVRGPRGGFSSPRVVYTAPKPREGLPPLQLQDVAAAPRGGAAVAVLPDGALTRPPVLLLTRRGRVAVSHAVRSDEPVREMHVVADLRGTAVVWATDNGLFVSATR